MVLVDVNGGVIIAVWVEGHSGGLKYTHTLLNT